jgi:hypothetical protein
MNWGPTLVSLVLVAPAAAQSASSADNDLQGKQIAIRACVHAGTHGSLGDLSEVAAVDPGARPDTPHRVMYWFHKNLDEFRDHVGQSVEITGTVREVLHDASELRATDGVFAEIALPVAAPVGTSGTTRDPVADATVHAPDSDNLPTLVVKAEVTKIRMLGVCR